MNPELFLFTLAFGALAGAFIGYFMAPRQTEEIELPDFAPQPAPRQRQPRAVTRLTHRERTIDI